MPGHPLAVGSCKDMEVWSAFHDLSLRTPIRDGHPAQILVFSDIISKKNADELSHT